MSLILKNLQAVNAIIAQAAHSVGRNPEEIVLLAVSKTFPAEAVWEAMQYGQSAFGENYLQEALGKINLLQQWCAAAAHAPPVWHFIGPIQSNKTRAIAENFAWVQSVERLKIAQRLSEQRPSDMPELQICLQVNISTEASKSGVTPDAVLELAQQISHLPRLRLRGLMAIPQANANLQQQQQDFAKMLDLMNSLQLSGFAVDTLSIGMSSDMAEAIVAGSTMVRVGSAIFGKRDYAH